MTQFDFDFSKPQEPQVTVEVHEQTMEYDREFAGMKARLRQDVYAFRLGADNPEETVEEEVTLPFVQTEAVHVVSEGDGQVTVEFPVTSDDEPVSALVFEDGDLKFRHDNVESIFAPDADGIAAAQQVFSALQAGLMAREANAGQE